jgi:hypothetical protein
LTCGRQERGKGTAAGQDGVDGAGGAADEDAAAGKELLPVEAVGGGERHRVGHADSGTREIAERAHIPAAAAGNGSPAPCIGLGPLLDRSPAEKARACFRRCSRERPD